MNIFVKHLMFSKAFAARRTSSFKEFRGISIKNICRLCCKCTGYIPIFNNGSINISEEINKIFDITIYRMKDCSNYICKTCYNFLESCIKFKVSCQRSQKLFNDYYKNKGTPDIMKKRIKVQPDTKSENLSIGDTLLDCDENILTDVMENEDFYLTREDCNKPYCDQEPQNQTMALRKVSRVKEKKATAISKDSKKRFLCETCGILAPSNAGLLIHMAGHQNSFPFKCEMCPYKGRTSNLLRIHKRSHLIEKPYKCSYCPKKTSTSSNLKKHITNVHSDLRPYKCNYCDKSFSYPSYTKRHIKEIHLRENRADCEICLKKFNTRKVMRGHMAKVHKVKLNNGGRLASYLKHELQENQMMD